MNRKNDKKVTIDKDLFKDAEFTLRIKLEENAAASV